MRFQSIEGERMGEAGRVQLATAPRTSSTGTRLLRATPSASLPSARLMARYADPRDMLAHEPVVEQIDEVRRSDLQQATGAAAFWQGPQGSVHVLLDAPWSRRVIGCLANELANREPDHAHAVLKEQGDGYVVSVRAPLARPGGAHALCSAFGGAGRSRAAGIDRLARNELPRFVEAFASASWG